ncbi:alkaline phosphatase D [Mycoplana sp. BE70]|uniref:alkaline phosphatase D family protein n=1 Tax=Mycoplana sp. BE70 TaxID=2817775 RepID=UPI00285431DC|nr:alkaline phosphatase D family protein [Mycoplana sp. BE70]MDR6757610.1 alkaline phosphatase D [Mycoplana sp. BE70]
MLDATGEMNRRAVLKALISIAAIPLLTLPSAAAVPKFAGDPFRLGVASGSPSADGFVLWTRLIDPSLEDLKAVDVGWEIYDESGGRPIAQGVTVATRHLAFSVHVEVSGLQPNRWYRYRFMVGSATSLMGRTRTLPRPGDAIESLRLSYASCQRWEHGHYAAYRQMLADRPDVVVFLGDYIYDLAARGKPLRGAGLKRIQTLRDYRARYALYKSDPLLQEMHAACPWLVTWDDHEIESNYAADLSMKGSENFIAKRAAGYLAYYEHMPIRSRTARISLSRLLKGTPLRLYEAYDFGNLARLYLLDARQYRAPPLCKPRKEAAEATPVDDLCLTRKDGYRTMLGIEQETWLRRSLEQSAAAGSRWNIICQQTRFTPRNYSSGIGKKFNSDTWDGYPEARQRLIDDLVETKVQNPVILGGDIHQNWVADVKHDPYDAATPTVAVEFCGTSISSRSGADADRVPLVVKRNPHCLLMDPAHRGYGLVDVSKPEMTVRLRAVDDVRQEASPVSTLATFTVEAGTPAIRRTDHG